MILKLWNAGRFNVLLLGMLLGSMLWTALICMFAVGPLNVSALAELFVFLNFVSDSRSEVLKVVSLFIVSIESRAVESTTALDRLMSPCILVAGTFFQLLASTSLMQDLGIPSVHEWIGLFVTRVQFFRAQKHFGEKLASILGLMISFKIVIQSDMISICKRMTRLPLSLTWFFRNLYTLFNKFKGSRRNVLNTATVVPKLYQKLDDLATAFFWLRFVGNWSSDPSTLYSHILELLKSKVVLMATLFLSYSRTRILAFNVITGFVLLLFRYERYFPIELYSTLYFYGAHEIVDQSIADLDDVLIGVCFSYLIPQASSSFAAIYDLFTKHQTKKLALPQETVTEISYTEPIEIQITFVQDDLVSNEISVEHDRVLTKSDSIETLSTRSRSSTPVLEEIKLTVPTTDDFDSDHDLSDATFIEDDSFEGTNIKASQHEQEVKLRKLLAERTLYLDSLDRSFSFDGVNPEILKSWQEMQKLKERKRLLMEILAQEQEFHQVLLSELYHRTLLR